MRGANRVMEVLLAEQLHAFMATVDALVRDAERRDDQQALEELMGWKKLLLEWRVMMSKRLPRDDPDRYWPAWAYRPPSMRGKDGENGAPK